MIAKASDPIQRQCPTFNSLQSLLRHVANEHPEHGLVIYSYGSVTNPKFTSYKKLYEIALRTSLQIRCLDGFQPGHPILLHLQTHWDSIHWLWAVLLAGGLPVPSSPFSNVEDHRKKHIQLLSTLLAAPICITTSGLLHLFNCDHELKLYTIEDLSISQSQQQYSLSNEIHEPQGNDSAVLMLTSGSTGNAKAVRLRHKQIIAAVAGKAGVRDLPLDRPFFNWIGMDHVAALTEIHLHAIYHGVDQIHVHASDLLCSPRTFLDLLSEHKVSRSFAPHFFLAKLTSLSINGDQQSWDFSDLKWLVSGGESNDVTTCQAVSSILVKHGAPDNVISTGFGMTETCAGAIYNHDCPNHDVRNNYTVASLGHCIEGIEMRVTVPTDDDKVSLAVAGDAGDLQVRGKVVFDEYYNDKVATAAAFTEDGWFRTGDRAFVDSYGHLNLTGRAKDTININGIKINPADVQTLLEERLGTLVHRVICYPTQYTQSDTERITVTYVPSDSLNLSENILQINNTIRQTSLQCSGAAAFAFALNDENLLPKTTLGKISRAKMRSLFESGVFDTHIERYQMMVKGQNSSSSNGVTTPSEAALLADIIEVLGNKSNGLGPVDPIFDVGMTSVDLIRLKHRVDNRLGLDIPITTIINYPTVRSMVPAIEDSASQTGYNPVVILRHEGTKTPLWLVHPGVGEVLVFLGLSKHLKNRPIYALRARGFDDDSRFADISDAVSTYCTAIQSRQPSGPYSIAGYSYGAMLAFEVAKMLESQGSEVRFLGSFNLPPHIKTRMKQLTWNMCILNLAYFLDLISEDRAESLEEEFKLLTCEGAFQKIMSIADDIRLSELGLNEDKIRKWADVAHGLQSMAVDYEPTGIVGAMDVFHAIPLRAAAKSRDDWVNNHLSKWADFCHTEPRFHQVGGAHYTMLGPEHVAGFSALLQQALSARDL